MALRFFVAIRPLVATRPLAIDIHSSGAHTRMAQKSTQVAFDLFAHAADDDRLALGIIPGRELFQTTPIEGELAVELCVAARCCHAWTTAFTVIS